MIFHWKYAIKEIRGVFVFKSVMSTVDTFYGLNMNLFC